MYKPESVLENEMDNILRNFAMQIGQLIFVRRPDSVLINKRKMTHHRVFFTVPSYYRVKIKEKKKN